DEGDQHGRYYAPLAPGAQDDRLHIGEPEGEQQAPAGEQDQQPRDRARPDVAGLQPEQADDEKGQVADQAEQGHGDPPLDHGPWGKEGISRSLYRLASADHAALQGPDVPEAMEGEVPRDEDTDQREKNERHPAERWSGRRDPP